MPWVSKTVNSLLAPLDLRLSRASSFNRLLSEVQQRHTAVVQSGQNNEREKHSELLDLSQSRWRGDEADAGLTWGVPMSGDEFVRALCEHLVLDNTTIVEIGPGYGRILDSLLKTASPFRRYIGLELSAARVTRLRDRFRDPRIEFREADVLGTRTAPRSA